MYLEQYKLMEMPFKITPDPRFLYMTPQHQEAIGRAMHVVNDRQGLAVIYGEVGMGKTTIARQLYAQISDLSNCKVGMLVTPALKTETAMLNAILAEFDLAPKRSYYKSLSAFQEYMIEGQAQETNFVIIIDEAQKLTLRMMDVLHTLLNFESNTEKFLQVVLIGQLELAANIDQVRAIKSRVAIFGKLSRLTEDDTKDMIAFRWHTASGGKSSHPFSEKALATIYELSSGLPREIIKLCHLGLISAAQEGADEVLPRHIKESAEALRLNKEDGDNA